MKIKIAAVVSTLVSLAIIGVMFGPWLIQRSPANAQNFEPIVSTPSSTIIDDSYSGMLQNSGSTKLTDKEEEQLRKLVPQTLKWLSVWETDPGCLQNKTDPSAPYRTFGEADKFAQIYKTFEGNNITVRFSPGDLWIDVYVVEAKVFIKFMRDKNFGIYATAPERRCDLPDEIRDYEARSYVVPPSESKSHNKSMWTKEKTELFNAIMIVAKANACTSLTYEKGKKITVTVPNFEIGDPRIDILLSSAGNKSIDSGLWIDFDYGEPKFVKNSGFADEIGKIIRKNAVDTRQIECDGSSGDNFER